MSNPEKTGDRILSHAGTYGAELNGIQTCADLVRDALIYLELYGEWPENMSGNRADGLLRSISALASAAYERLGSAVGDETLLIDWQGRSYIERGSLRNSGEATGDSQAMGKQSGIRPHSHR